MSQKRSADLDGVLAPFAGEELLASRIRLAFEAIDSTGAPQPMVPIGVTACARGMRDAR